MTVTRKLLVPTLLIFALGLLGVTALGASSIANSLQEQELEDLNRYQQLFQNRLIELESFAVALATEVANNPEVQVALAAGDRERLIELTLPAYEQLDEQFDVPQHAFHLAPAISYLRLHDPELYGEDLSLYRPSVVLANAEQRPVAGPEIGRSGLGVRGVVPVTHSGEHIGTVEFGLNVDRTLLEQMKAQFGGEWQILLDRDAARFATVVGSSGETTGPTATLLLQASTLAEPFFGEPSAYQQVLNGAPVTTPRSQNGREFALFSYPLRDFSGNVIGVLEVVSDQTEVIYDRNLGLSIAIGVSLLALLVGGGALAFFATRTLRPVGELTDAATAIAAGDLNRTIPVPAKSEDEIGQLARAFESMTGQLRNLIGSLEERVADRTRRLETVAVINERLNAILNVDELLAEVVNQIQQSFGYYHAHIYLLDETGEKLVVAEGTGPAGAEMKERGHSIALSAPKSLVAQAARTGQVTKVDNVLADEGWLPNPLLPDTQAEMAVPITLTGQVVGVLDVQADEIGGLDESDANLLRSVANQVAVAIRNARLFAEVQAALAEAQVTQQRYVEQTWERVARARRGAAYHYQRPGAPAVDEAMVAGLEREMMVQQDASPNETEGYGSDETSTALAMPIKLQDQTIGLIQLHDTDQQRHWHELDLALIQAVAGQVAQAAETLRLFEESQDRAAREATIREITDKLRAASSLDVLLETAGRELGQRLGVPQTVLELGIGATPTPATGGNGQDNGAKGEE